MPSPLVLHPGEREFPRLLFVASLLLCAICVACGAVGSSAPPPLPMTITVTPNSAKPFPGGVVQFHAVVENASSSGVNWLVNGMSPGDANVGMIDSTGLYIAPNAVPNPATVTVTAALQADSSVTASANVAIQGSLSISPAHSSFSAALPVQLNAAGIDNSALNWAVDNVGGGNPTVGTILDGLYTPPPQTGSHRITATLKADASVFGLAIIDITGFQGMLTWRNDPSRSGVNSQELALTPGTVSPSTFGKLFSCEVDGYVYAQPLYLPNLKIPGQGTHNVIFVATENDSVFAFDADVNLKPCVPLWKTSLIPLGLNVISNTNMDIAPFVGITGTPVIDGSTSTPWTLYVVAAAQTVPVPPEFNPTYSHWLYALDLTAVPPEIQPPGAGVGIASPGSPISAFNSSAELQGPALLLDHGTVYIAFGSNGLPNDYHGWLFGYDALTLQRTGVFDVTPPPGSQGGIWQSGGGPSADSNHNVYVVAGDGPFDVNRGGMNYSDSLLRFDASRGLSVPSYFTPYDQATLSGTGQNGGTSAPVLLPDSAFPSLPHLMIGGFKNGCIYVVNSDNMEGSISNCSDSTPPVQLVAVGDGPILSTPLFWNGAVYVAAANGKLKSFSLAGGTIFSSSPTMQSPEALGPIGATPVISSNGVSNAILWLIDTSGASSNSPAILRAYDPNNLSNEIYNSAISPLDKAGLAVKFAVPTVANGKVYVGTQTELDVYGLLP